MKSSTAADDVEQLHLAPNAFEQILNRGQREAEVSSLPPLGQTCAVEIQASRERGLGPVSRKRRDPGLQDALFAIRADWGKAAALAPHPATLRLSVIVLPQFGDDLSLATRHSTDLSRPPLAVLVETVEGALHGTEHCSQSRSTKICKVSGAVDLFDL
jgi:hypothetical protein